MRYNKQKQSNHQQQQTPNIQGSFYTYLKHAFQSTFQSLELCNETICHNKVPDNFDFFRCIPYGKKAFLWFHYNYRKNIPECHFFELDHKTKSIQCIYAYRVCYHPSLTTNHGTLLYGTIHNSGEKNTFYVEDCLHMNTVNCSNFGWKQKYSSLFPHISQSIKPIIYSNIDIEVYFLPTYKCLDSDKQTIQNTLPFSISSIYSIQYLRHNKIFTQPMNKDKLQNWFEDNTTIQHNTNVNTNNNNTIQHDENIKPSSFRNIFKVRPCIQCDIYEAYCKDEEFVGTLYIPSYTTSVMMNSYFRHIQENNNLDALEESDDEDMFQNIEITKFVNLNAEEYFECEYNTQFKMWVPVKHIDMCDFQEQDLPPIQHIYSFYSSLKTLTKPTTKHSQKQHSYSNHKKNMKYLPKNYTEKSFKQTFCVPKYK